MALYSYQLRHGDNSIQFDHVWMTELAHDGCLLQELGLDGVVLPSSAHLHCHLHWLHKLLRPFCQVDCPKLTTANVLHDPDNTSACVFSEC